MPTRTELRAAIALLTVGILLAMPAVIARLQVEQAYRTYEVVVDFDSLRILAGTEGLTLTQAARVLKKAGAVSLSADLTTADPASLLFDRKFAGLDPRAVETAEAVGLKLVGRIPFVSRATTEEIAEVFLQVKASTGRPIILTGELILGYPDRLGFVADRIASQGLLLGEVEFSTQKGLTSLRRNLVNRFVRVHTITPEETDLISFDTALARWLRAVQERNIRMLYFHPFLPHSVAVGESEASALDVSAKMLAEITSGLAAVGYRTGPSPVLPDFPEVKWGFWGALLGLIGPAYLLLRQVCGEWRICQVMPVARIALVLALLVLMALQLIGQDTIARQAVALGIAVIFPSVAVILPLQQTRRVTTGVLEAFALLAVGVILIVAALAQPEFILKIEQFLGVKLMHVFPPLLVAWFLWQHGCFRGWSWNRLTLLLIPLAVLAGAYLVLRTGNISMVSDWERQVRDVLERLLVVRPRTKEFMLGHPALLVGMWLYFHTQNRVGAAALLTIGTVGLLSILNTFTHIHTPLMVSVLRTFNGLWLGAVIGLIAVVALRLISRGERT